MKVLYEQWQFQVKGYEEFLSRTFSKNSALITSVRGEASKLISFVGFSAPVDSIIEAMDKMFWKESHQ